MCCLTETDAWVSGELGEGQRWVQRQDKLHTNGFKLKVKHGDENF